MRAHSYVPVKEPTNQITVSSMTLILLLVCQLLLPLMNHHAFDFYPNHPHLPNTQQHSHSYTNAHMHQNLDPGSKTVNTQSISIIELAFLPDWSFNAALVGMLIIWKWSRVTFAPDSTSILFKSKSAATKHLLSIFYPVQTNPPIPPY